MLNYYGSNNEYAFVVLAVKIYWGFSKIVANSAEFNERKKKIGCCTESSNVKSFICQALD